MSTSEIINNLDRILSDSRVLNDLQSTIEKEIKRGGLSHEDVQKLSSLDHVGDVVNKRFIAMRYDVGFGTHYVCRIAVGGVLSHSHGIVTARLFMAELIYNADLSLITVDFIDNTTDSKG